MSRIHPGASGARGAPCRGELHLVPWATSDAVRCAPRRRSGRGLSSSGYGRDGWCWPGRRLSVARGRDNQRSLSLIRGGTLGGGWGFGGSVFALGRLVSQTAPPVSVENGSGSAPTTVSPSSARG